MEAMFNNIASRYDFLNHFLSCGVDKIWRRKLVKRVAASDPQQVLDIATGTADLSIKLAKRCKNVKIIGVDISEQMLQIGVKKVQKLGLSSRVELKKASAMQLPFADSSFNCVMVAFGVRNFENLRQGINEAYRVVTSGGMFYVLEFSTPTKFLIASIYKFYFRHFLPVLGGWISGSREAYRYLPQSVEQFPQGINFLAIMQNSGFVGCVQKKFGFGIATLYMGTKPSE